MRKHCTAAQPAILQCQHAQPSPKGLQSCPRQTGPTLNARPVRAQASKGQTPHLRCGHHFYVPLPPDGEPASQVVRMLQV